MVAEELRQELKVACYQGDIEKVQELILDHALIEYFRQPFLTSPLHIVAEKISARDSLSDPDKTERYNKVGQLLLETPSIDVNQQDYSRKSALFYLSDAGPVSPLFKSLVHDPRVDITIGCDMEDVEYTPLQQACSYSNNPNSVSYLMLAYTERGLAFPWDLSTSNSNIQRLIVKKDNKAELYAEIERQSPGLVDEFLKLESEQERSANLFAQMIFHADGLLELPSFQPEMSADQQPESTTSLIQQTEKLTISDHNNPEEKTGEVKKEEPLSEDEVKKDNARRFFSMANKLPMELQMVLAARAGGETKDTIPSEKREAAFKQLAGKYPDKDSGQSR